MPQRVVQQSVVVMRDGKRVTPKIGETFDFTAEEIEQAGADALREPKDETRSARTVQTGTPGEKGAAEAARVPAARAPARKASNDEDEL